MEYPSMMLSMLVPVYNGASFLEPCIEELTRWQSEEARNSEIIVCEDGSTDGTKQLCGVLKTRYPSVRFIHEDTRLGRGGALRRAALSAHGDVLVYVDVDMASDPRFLDRVIGEAMNGSDVVTGSRYLSQSRSTRSFMRFACSKAYNLLVRVLFKSPIRDHQCGFKAFRRDVLREVLPTVRSNHWFWDTEFLVRATKLGFRVTEVPIAWSECEDGTTVRLRDDIPYFLREVLSLWKEFRSQKAS